jgi:hypothetical protein
MDYDTRFKLLLTLFFQEFVELFLPDFHPRVDWRRPIEFLDKELQSVLPDRPKGTVDLLAKVAAKRGQRAGRQGRLCLIHVEIEGRKSRREMAERMCGYYHRLREKLRLPTVPVAVFVHLGGEGLGWLNDDMVCLDHCFNHFECPYIGLPALDGRQYLERPNPLAWALTGLMSVPDDERARVKAESMRRAAATRLAERERFLVLECVESFTNLDTAQQRVFQTLLGAPGFEEVRVMQKTTYEKGLDKGREEGREEGIEKGVHLAECRFLLMQLEEKFGGVSERVRKKVEQMTSDQRQEVAKRLIAAERLKDLQL